MSTPILLHLVDFKHSRESAINRDMEGLQSKLFAGNITATFIASQIFLNAFFVEKETEHFLKKINQPFVFLHIPMYSVLHLLLPKSQL